MRTSLFQTQRHFSTETRSTRARSAAAIGFVVLCTACARTQPVVEKNQPAPVPTPATTERASAPVASHPGLERIVATDDVARGRAGSPAPHPHDHPNFDRAAYVADPASYLKAIVGSRIYEVSNPAADVEPLTPVGSTGATVRTNEETVLAARTEPGMPVTFTSFGLGMFPMSGQSSVTVAADSEGIARTPFRVTPGTVRNCLIVAGSPVCAGTLQFLIAIPETP